MSPIRQVSPSRMVKAKTAKSKTTRTGTSKTRLATSEIEEPKIAKPKIEKPKTEKPKTEKPKAEKPVIAPAVEKPKTTRVSVTREKADTPQQPDPPFNEASLLERLERVVTTELSLVEAEQVRAKAGGAAAGELSMRTVTQLIDSLGKIRRLCSEPAVAAPTVSDDYDDEPADIDEFRRALARRIDLLVQSRADGDLPDDGEFEDASAPPS